MNLLLLGLLSPSASAATVLYGNLAGGLGFTLHNIGDFALGVEQLFGARHGVLAEGTFIHVHGDPTHSTIYGGQLGYRVHLDQAFIGVVGGYELGYTKYFIAEHGGPYHRYGLRHLSLVPHIGYRWPLGEHLVLTARFGAGLGSWRVEIPTDGGAAEAQLIEDRLQFSPVKLDSELSLGWRF